MKQKLNEEKRKKYEEYRDSLLKKQIEDSQRKGEEINRILEKNKEMEEKKVKDYYKKQEHLQNQKAAIEVILQDEANKKQILNQAKEQKLQQVLQVNEYQENMKKQDIMKKLEIKEISVY
jgi:TusA-related sulfurtransferase